MLSLPIAIAEEGSSSDDSELNESRVDDSQEIEVEARDKTGVRTRLKESVKDGEVRKELEVRDENSRLRVKERLLARDLPDNAVVEARLRFEQAKENFLEARTRYEERMKEFREAGAEEKDAKARNFLGVSIDVFIEHLTKIKAQVQANENIEEERANEIISYIDSSIAKVTELKAKIDNSETKEELKQNSRELRLLFVEIKQTVSRHSQRIVNSKQEYVLERTESLERRLANTEVRGEVNQEKLRIFTSFMIEARNKFNEAKDLLNSGGDAATVKRLNMESREALKQAHQALKEITNEIKEKRPGFNINEVEDILLRGAENEQ